VDLPLLDMMFLSVTKTEEARIAPRRKWGFSTSATESVELSKKIRPGVMLDFIDMLDHVLHVSVELDISESNSHLTLL
jgi:hypothetical protein